MTSFATSVSSINMAKAMHFLKRGPTVPMQLLAKAGYKGSGGLGPLESGITSPLPAWHNQGRMGIGSAPSQQPASNSHSSTRAGHLSMGEVSHGSGEGSSSGKAKSHDQRQQQTQKRSKPPHTEWASVRVEEDLQVLCYSHYLQGAGWALRGQSSHKNSHCRWMSQSQSMGCRALMLSSCVDDTKKSVPVAKLQRQSCTCDRCAAQISLACRSR